MPKPELGLLVFTSEYNLCKKEQKQNPGWLAKNNMKSSTQRIIPFTLFVN